MTRVGPLPRGRAGAPPSRPGPACMSRGRDGLLLAAGKARLSAVRGSAQKGWLPGSAPCRAAAPAAAAPRFLPRHLPGRPRHAAAATGSPTPTHRLCQTLPTGASAAHPPIDQRVQVTKCPSSFVPAAKTQLLNSIRRSGSQLWQVPRKYQEPRSLQCEVQRGHSGVSESRWTTLCASKPPQAAVVRTLAVKSSAAAWPCSVWGSAWGGRRIRTTALSVSKFTAAASMAGSATRMRRTAAEHPPHFIPRTSSTTVSTGSGGSRASVRGPGTHPLWKGRQEVTHVQPNWDTKHGLSQTI